MANTKNLSTNMMRLKQAFRSIIVILKYMCPGENKPEFLVAIMAILEGLLAYIKDEYNEKTQ